jgi:hypothetical protein
MAIIAQQGALILELAKESGTLVVAEAGISYVKEITDKGKLLLTAWRGKSTKPVYRYLVRDDAHAKQAIDELIRRATAANAIRAQATEKRKQEKAEQRGKYAPGTLLCHSWGYEQTNIDYYQVVAASKSGATVTVRRIASKHIAATGFMSETVGPAVGVFIGEPIKKQVGAYGVQFKYGWTSIVNADETHSATSYA